MTTILDNYTEYAQASLANYAKRDAASKHLLVDAVKGLRVERVLDVGCGAGQDLLPFLEKTAAFCVGIDTATELGAVTAQIFGSEKRVAFVRSEGERLPFGNESFDVVLCRVALPYMNNREAIEEVSRILKPNGVYLLKTHAPKFYFEMIRKRAKTLNPKQLVFPLVCLAGSFWHLLTGKRLKGGIWKGKEIFQTQGFLEKVFTNNGLEIKGFLPDNSSVAQSYMVVKR
ncbi:MAG: class I SAM-dependent methyltransferase [Pyrinomonadaceae bacterium]